MTAYNQTAEQAEAKIIRFASAEDCETYIKTHDMIAISHPSKGEFIAVCFLVSGIFGVSSPCTCELLPDW